MAKCCNYETGQNCPSFYRCSGKDETVQVGTSIKRLHPYSFYCMATPGVKKIAGLADFTGRTPKWCPLGRDEDE